MNSPSWRTAQALSSRDAQELNQLLTFLKTSCGFDFSGYKRASLIRRFQKRMRAIGVTGFLAYADYLEREPAELGHLLDTVLINVTAFFRDGTPWDRLRNDVVPRLVADKAPDAPIRVWCAACATGEEAYTVAMVLADVLGHDTFRSRVTIYATDIDEVALAHARKGVYDAKQVAPIPPDSLKRYFERQDTVYRFRRDLRRSLVFGRNDLVQDAPLSRLDLLVARNILMYFTAPTQAHVLGRFSFALNDGGYLFLGRSETVLTQRAAFTAIDLRHRIFVRNARGVS